MTRQEYIDFISNVLSPIDKTNRFHKENIRVACDLVYAQRMTTVDESMTDIEVYSKEYTAQDVTLDATKNKYYTDMPCEIVSIPGVTSGLRHIAPNQGFDLDMVPVTELEINYLGGSVTQLVDTTVGYWRQGQKVWYDESMTPAIAAAGVRMIVLPRFSEFDRDDVVQIPGCTDLDFIGQVIQLIAPSAPVDLKANNA
jgi:hypothetical protein